MAHGRNVRLTPRYPASIPVDDDIEIRPVTESDAPRIFALTERNREFLAKWLPWVPFTRTVGDSEGFVQRAHEQMRRGEGFHACIEHRGELVGVIGHAYLDPGNRRAEVGYWLGEEFQGRGIMTRACRALVDYGFRSLGLNRTEIRVDVDNRKSRAIPERLGFVQEAVLRESVQDYGRFRDIVMYAMLRRDWEVEGVGRATKSLDGGPAVPRAKE